MTAPHEAANVKKEQNRTSIDLMMGGGVGIKDMLMGDGTQRLTVRTQGTDGSTGIGAVYLSEAECLAVARALLPGWIMTKEATHA